MKRFLVATALVVMTSPGCGSSDGSQSYSNGFSPSVGQGGSQDFGRFRDILDAGNIPGPSTIDSVGFFNEHVIDLPEANCGEDLCLHGQLGVMGNMITGSNCTLLMVGMNTPLDASQMERPPLNLVVVVDTSGSMSGAPLDNVVTGLLSMLEVLTPEDRISLVTFASDAQVKAAFVSGDDEGLKTAIGGLVASGYTNIYAGLALGAELLDEQADPQRQNRILLLSDGEASIGITDSERIVGLAESYNALGYGFTTIGLGTSFDADLMRRISEAGGGAFYYVEDIDAVEEVFVQEAQAFLVPLATDVVIEVNVSSGYRLATVHGTKRFTIVGNQATITLPSVQLAHRTSDNDNAEGRRGGGGAILLELIPTVGDPGSVSTIDFSFVKPTAVEPIAVASEVNSLLAPGETPAGGYFDFDGVEKSFIMLNLYAGFEIAATRSAVGDYAGALAVLDALQQNVGEWVLDNPDADIEDDLVYVDAFIENIEAVGGRSSQLPPQEPWPAD